MGEVPVAVRCAVAAVTSRAEWPNEMAESVGDGTSATDESAM